MSDNRSTWGPSIATQSYQQYHTTRIETDRLFYDLAKEYERRAEAFDQRVCTGRTENGTAMPMTAQQSQAINEHAKMLRREMIQRAVRQTRYSRGECEEKFQSALWMHQRHEGARR